MAIRTLKNIPEDAIYQIIPSPVGDLYGFATDKALYALLWENEAESQELTKQLESRRCSSNIVLKQTKAQLKEWFSGKRQKFDLPLKLVGTPFQISAWKALQKIPYGKTISYGQQASNLGDKNKARAVGHANSQNPIGIIVPCHRVIGASGKLVGFGGGLSMKQQLLDLEARHAD